LRGAATARSARAASGERRAELLRRCALPWEVKAASTPLTAAQDHWLDALEAAGGDADIWQERDLLDGSVRVEIYALNGVTVPREPWIPEGSTPEDAAHLFALYAD
jgi:hypothetical protein